MTQVQSTQQENDPFDLSKGQIVDPSKAADGLGRLLSVLSGLTSGGPQTTASAQQIGQSTFQAQPDQPTAATSPDVSVPAITGDQNTVDPVPQGTGITQGYHGDTGGHPGIDLGVPLDTPLLAAQSGTVTVASNADPGGYGLEVEIATGDGYHIRYGHLHSTGLKVGDTVKAGQVIGNSGGEAGGPTSGNSEGPHLHFEVRGPDGNTVDPTPWLAGGHAIVSAAPHTITSTIAKPIDPQSAIDTGLARVSGVLGGSGDPGSQNQQQTTSTTTTVPGSGSMSGADSDPSAIDAFLNATKQHESGGDYTVYNQSGLSNASGAYQFIGTTWNNYGGYANAAEAPPAVQDAKAREMASALFSEFHSWRLVAIAWYGGPGIAQQVAAGQDPGSPSGQGGYLDYGNTIASMMAGGK